MQSIDHSWYGIVSHVYRSNARIFRAKIGALWFLPHGIYLSTSSTCVLTHKTILKDVSPLEIAALDVLWSNIEVMSDPDSIELDEFNIPIECHQNLPPLTLGTNVSLNAEQQQAFDCLALSIRNFQKTKHLLC